MSKILLVEDDQEISTMLKNFLMTENYEVEVAFDGESACNKFFSGSFSLILLDLMIPKMSGMEVMEKIRENSTVPIIIMSAKDTDSDKTLGLGLGRRVIYAQNLRRSFDETLQLRGSGRKYRNGYKERRLFRLSQPSRSIYEF